jgi:hypothetical protein
MPDRGSRRVNQHEVCAPLPEAAEAPRADVQLKACVAAARDRLLARGVWAEGAGRVGPG